MHYGGEGFVFEISILGAKEVDHVPYSELLGHHSQYLWIAWAPLEGGHDRVPPKDVEEDTEWGGIDLKEEITRLINTEGALARVVANDQLVEDRGCLLYTSDAADEEDSVDLGGRRIIKKKKKLADRDTWD
eukprot:TRINITY_DN57496_c0_g1_i1.p1 TRINITY_DN57496_c0_g1~~TRINITY_DN57496_c0_g1_i1.p1  ORF type:complete len:131 (+),score=18.08 TRINITY_DN57496_c0_g1_i1:246-638(+)